MFFLFYIVFRSSVPPDELLNISRGAAEVAEIIVLCFPPRSPRLHEVPCGPREPPCNHNQGYCVYQVDPKQRTGRMGRYFRVEAASMDSFEHGLAKFFGVVVRGQTYINIAYLFLAFPLGLFYFIFLVTGISLGISLAILWVGLFILLGTYAAWYALAAFERQMAITMLHEDIPPMIQANLSGMSLWQRFRHTLPIPVTWKALAYLFARFPLGIFSFTVVVTLAALSTGLIAAPLYYSFIHPQVGVVWDGWNWGSLWVIDSLDKALICSLVGVLLGVASLHVMNWLAWTYGKFARVMLGGSPTAQAAAPAAVPQAAPASQTPSQAG